jgi:hypothetical protein
MLANLANSRYELHADLSKVDKRRGVLRGGVEFWRGVNPLRDRLKLDNCVTRAMWVVMKLVRVASNRHLRNWDAPDALVQEIVPVAR